MRILGILFYLYCRILYKTSIYCKRLSVPPEMRIAFHLSARVPQRTYVTGVPSTVFHILLCSTIRFYIISCHVSSTHSRWEFLPPSIKERELAAERVPTCERDSLSRISPHRYVSLFRKEIRKRDEMFLFSEQKFPLRALVIYVIEIHNNGNHDF